MAKHVPLASGSPTRLTPLRCALKNREHVQRCLRYPYGPPPAKKGMSGCLITVLVLGGIGLIEAVIIVVFLAQIWSLLRPGQSAARRRAS